MENVDQHDVPLSYIAIRPISVPLTNTGALIINKETLLAGWSLVEPTGTVPAACTLYDGGDAGGQPLAYITLTAGESTRDLFTAPGLYCTRGLFVAVTAGSVQGVMWLRDQ
jgi:hypothetical protein